MNRRHTEGTEKSAWVGIRSHLSALLGVLRVSVVLLSGGESEPRLNPRSSACPTGVHRALYESRKPFAPADSAQARTQRPKGAPSGVIGGQTPRAASALRSVALPGRGLQHARVFLVIRMIGIVRILCAKNRWDLPHVGRVIDLPSLPSRFLPAKRQVNDLPYRWRLAMVGLLRVGRGSTILHQVPAPVQVGEAQRPAGSDQQAAGVLMRRRWRNCTAPFHSHLECRPRARFAARWRR